ncbi:MAG: RNA polymerase sigma factor [bacterium]
MEKTDLELVTSYLDGDEESLRTLIERHSDSLYNFVYRFGGKDDSADITQEIFVKVWKNLHKFDREKNFKTWLFAIARNTVTDWLRKRKHILFSDMDSENMFFEDSLVDEEMRPDEISVLAHDKQKLEQALEKLSPEYKAVLLLRYSEDFTFKEIGEILDKSQNTVKSQHTRALDQLKKILKK